MIWCKNCESQLKEIGGNCDHCETDNVGVKADVDMSKYFTRCGDCGQMLKREHWIRKETSSSITHGLCPSCLSDYDDGLF